MPLLRICDAVNLNKWDKEPCDFGAIIREWFNPDRDPNPSVYLVYVEHEEVEVAAAHVLTDLSPNLKGVYLLRIEWSDLIAVGAREGVSGEVPGTTGVVRTDFCHRELVGARAYLEALVWRIRERYEAGEPRFRWVGPPVLRRQLTQFCSLENRQVIQEAKRRCRHKLGGPGMLPRPRGEELRRQLLAACPRIPEEVIRERAYKVYQRSGRHEAAQNWAEAEAELLEAYIGGFTHYRSPAPSPPTV
jgi:hypothetical protein